MIYGIAYNTWVVLAGVSLLGASAGIVGSFAVLRRRSLTGDALAHAALPGLCLAFLFAGEQNMLVMLFGALLTGILGVVIISALRTYTRIKEDAAIGIVLSVFFGAGAVLSRIIQNRPGGSRAGIQTFIFGSPAGMIFEDLLWLAILSAGILFCVLLLYKEFKLISFDPDFAYSQGWPVYLLDLLLMGLLAITVVVGLPAVGVLMVAALLIIPAATARFWTEQLGMMLAMSAIFGVVSAMFGTMVSATYVTMPTGPTIILVATIFFLLSGLFSPSRGMARKWWLARGKLKAPNGLGVNGIEQDESHRTKY